MCFGDINGQQNKAITVNNNFISISTDAIAAGKGGIGVATAPDVFSQSWNPSKYMFSDKKSEIGLTQIATNSRFLKDFSQLN